MIRIPAVLVLFIVFVLDATVIGVAAINANAHPTCPASSPP